MLHTDLSFFDTLPDSALIREKVIIGAFKRPAGTGGDGVSIQISPQIVPVSRSTWQRMVKSGDAPAPVKLTKGVSAWRVGELRVWLAQAGSVRT